MLRLQVRYLWKSWLPLTRKRRTEFFLTSAKWGGADHWSSFSWVPLTPFTRFQKEPAAIHFSRLLVNEHRSHARAPHRVIFRSVWKGVDSPFDEYLSRRLLVFTKTVHFINFSLFCKWAPLSRESAAPSYFPERLKKCRFPILWVPLTPFTRFHEKKHLFHFSRFL